MKHFFSFDSFKTSYKQESVAGVTTFLTMAYIIVVNPAILENAGIPKGPSMTATILAAAFGSLIMSLYAKRPFALAPYMGENAFIAFTVVKLLGLSWQTALGAIFIAGVLFTLLTVLKIRGKMADAIPSSLKFSFSAGIGFFLAFIGLCETGIVSLGIPGAPVKLGDFSQPQVMLSIFGFFLIIWLMIIQVKGAVIIGILSITASSFLLALSPVPSSFISMPPSIAPIFFQLDLTHVFTARHLPVVLIIFVLAYVDTVGTLLGLSARGGLLDKQGNLPDIEKPMLADAIANMIAPILGTTTTGAYIESATGIEEGGRTGFTSLVVSVLFLFSLFFSPVLTSVPPHAYGTALIVIGIFMISPVFHLDFKDYTEFIPAFVTIVMMVFTFNIGVGMTSGLITYPVLKVLSNRSREVSSGMWVFFVLSLSFYFVYPYHG